MSGGGGAIAPKHVAAKKTRTTSEIFHQQRTKPYPVMGVMVDPANFSVPVSPSASSGAYFLYVPPEYVLPGEPLAMAFKNSVPGRAYQSLVAFFFANVTRFGQFAVSREEYVQAFVCVLRRPETLVAGAGDGEGGGGGAVSYGPAAPPGLLFCLFEAEKALLNAENPPEITEGFNARGQSILKKHQKPDPLELKIAKMTTRRWQEHMHGQAQGVRGLRELFGMSTMNQLIEQQLDWWTPLEEIMDSFAFNSALTIVGTVDKGYRAKPHAPLPPEYTAECLSLDRAISLMQASRIFGEGQSRESIKAMFFRPREGPELAGLYTFPNSPCVEVFRVPAEVARRGMTHAFGWPQVQLDIDPSSVAFRQYAEHARQSQPLATDEEIMAMFARAGLSDVSSVMTFEHTMDMIRALALSNRESSADAEEAGTGPPIKFTSANLLDRTWRAMTPTAVDMGTGLRSVLFYVSDWCRRAENCGNMCGLDTYKPARAMVGGDNMATRLLLQMAQDREAFKNGYFITRLIVACLIAAYTAPRVLCHKDDAMLKFAIVLLGRPESGKDYVMNVIKLLLIIGTVSDKHDQSALLASSDSPEHLIVKLKKEATKGSLGLKDGDNGPVTAKQLIDQVRSGNSDTNTNRESALGRNIITDRKVATSYVSHNPRGERGSTDTESLADATWISGFNNSEWLLPTAEFLRRCMLSSDPPRMRDDPIDEKTDTASATLAPATAVIEELSPMQTDIVEDSRRRQALIAIAYKMIYTHALPHVDESLASASLNWLATKMEDYGVFAPRLARPMHRVILAARTMTIGAAVNLVFWAGVNGPRPDAPFEARHMGLLTPFFVTGVDTIVQMVYMYNLWRNAYEQMALRGLVALFKSKHHWVLNQRVVTHRFTATTQPPADDGCPVSYGFGPHYYIRNFFDEKTTEEAEKVVFLSRELAKIGVDSKEWDIIYGVARVLCAKVRVKRERPPPLLPNGQLNPSAPVEEDKYDRAALMDVSGRHLILNASVLQHYYNHFEMKDPHPLDLAVKELYRCCEVRELCTGDIIPAQGELTLRRITVGEEDRKVRESAVVLTVNPNFVSDRVRAELAQRREDANLAAVHADAKETFDARPSRLPEVIDMFLATKGCIAKVPSREPVSAPGSPETMHFARPTNLTKLMRVHDAAVRAIHEASRPVSRYDLGAVTRMLVRVHERFWTFREHDALESDLDAAWITSFVTRSGYHFGGKGAPIWPEIGSVIMAHMGWRPAQSRGERSRDLEMEFTVAARKFIAAVVIVTARRKFESGPSPPRNKNETDAAFEEREKKHRYDVLGRMLAYLRIACDNSHLIMHTFFKDNQLVAWKEPRAMEFLARLPADVVANQDTEGKDDETSLQRVRRLHRNLDRMNEFIKLCTKVVSELVRPDNLVAVFAVGAEALCAAALPEMSPPALMLLPEDDPHGVHAEQARAEAAARLAEIQERDREQDRVRREEETRRRAEAKAAREAAKAKEREEAKAAAIARAAEARALRAAEQKQPDPLAAAAGPSASSPAPPPANPAPRASSFPLVAILQRSAYQLPTLVPRKNASGPKRRMDIEVMEDDGRLEIEDVPAAPLAPTPPSPPAVPSAAARAGLERIPRGDSVGPHSFYVPLGSPADGTGNGNETAADYEDALMRAQEEQDGGDGGDQDMPPIHKHRRRIAPPQPDEEMIASSA